MGAASVMLVAACSLQRPAAPFPHEARHTDTDTLFPAAGSFERCEPQAVCLMSTVSSSQPKLVPGILSSYASHLSSPGLNSLVHPNPLHLCPSPILLLHPNSLPAPATAPAPLPQVTTLPGPKLPPISCIPTSYPKLPPVPKLCLTPSIPPLISQKSLALDHLPNSLSGSPANILLTLGLIHLLDIQVTH